jgi:hypothetical protein
MAQDPRGGLGRDRTVAELPQRVANEKDLKDLA